MEEKDGIDLLKSTDGLKKKKKGQGEIMILRRKRYLKTELRIYPSL